MSETNPTTQLVEAINRAYKENLKTYIHLPDEINFPKCTTAILRAIADAVDAQIGGKHSPGPLAITATDISAAYKLGYSNGFNAANDRMRTFTAALRERAK